MSRARLRDSPDHVPDAELPGVTAAGRPRARVGRSLAFLGAGLAVAGVLAAIHLTQGTSAVGVTDLLRLLAGDDDAHTRLAADVLAGSRIPRLLAGLVVGVALGVAGALLQSVARNPLASPDTLGVNAGAQLAVTVVAVIGVSLPVLPSGGVAMAGGLLAAGLVVALSAGGQTSPTRLVLAGAATTMALAAASAALMLINEQSTSGLFFWGNGSLVQSNADRVLGVLPLLAAGLLVATVLTRGLDILALGDDPARVLGVRVGRLRLGSIVTGVLLAAVAVTVAGPVGFVGLTAPTLARLAGQRWTGVGRHAVLLPASALAGVIVVLGSDILLRSVFGGSAGVRIPTGVATTLLGAPVLVWLARRYRDSGPTRTPPGATHRLAGSRAAFVGVLAATAAVALAAAYAGLTLGPGGLLPSDLPAWLAGEAPRVVGFIVDQRLPRIVVALLAGAALTLAGAAIQAVCRNPLAEPGLIGVSGGASLGAVAVLVAAPGLSGALMPVGAGLGGLLAFVAVYTLAWRSGLTPDRFVLVGIGISAVAAAITSGLASGLRFSISEVLTWLSGSTYARSYDDLLPLFVALVLAVPAAALIARRLDLLAVDDDTPRVLGVRLERTRLGVLAGAALLAAAAVSTVGAIGFVGLVAPHAARALVGGRHRRLLPVAGLLGAALVCLADTVGRTVIAPAQLPAGLLTALLGAPYFLWLLWRSRPERA